MSMRIGIVVATHPEDHSVDLVMADDGSRMVGVQVLANSASTRSGAVDMPSVPAKADKWDITKPSGQDMKAIVGFVGRTPVVLGFLYPQINQMTLNDPNTRLFRHQSDVISVIDGNGNIDLLHPSGFSIRIGETPDHINPAGMNADGNLAQDRNTGRKAYLRVSTSGGTAVLTITPDGAVSLTCDKTVDVIAQKEVTVQTPVSVTLDTPNTFCTGNLSVTKAFVVQGTGVTGKAAKITGDFEIIGNTDQTGTVAITGGALTHNGTNVGSTHTHSGVQPGGGNTGAPN